MLCKVFKPSHQIGFVAKFNGGSTHEKNLRNRNQSSHYQSSNSLGKIKKDVAKLYKNNEFSNKAHQIEKRRG